MKGLFQCPHRDKGELLVISVNLAGDGPAIESLGPETFSMLNVKCLE